MGLVPQVLVALVVVGTDTSVTVRLELLEL
jgi:hypothetical protein